MILARNHLLLLNGNKLMRSSILLALVFWTTLLYSQTYPTRNIGKDSYYVYTVQPGNTLYAISRQFSVTVNDLNDTNPGMSDGLSPGQEILIPIAAVNKKTNKNQQVSLEGEFILHTVQPKETLFSISKSYSISVSDIQFANPESIGGIQAGSVLRIPSTASSATSAEFVKPASLGNQKLHRVEKGETVYSIAKKYDLTPTQIQDANGFSSNDRSKP